jgi:predicted neuraminidase
MNESFSGSEVNLIMKTTACTATFTALPDLTQFPQFVGQNGEEAESTYTSKARSAAISHTEPTWVAEYSSHVRFTSNSLSRISISLEYTLDLTSI